MKRYGEYGFTFDSKADEWAAWIRSKALMAGHITRKMRKELGDVVSSASPCAIAPQWLWQRWAFETEDRGYGSIVVNVGLGGHEEKYRKAVAELAESSPRDHMGDFARHSPAQQQNDTGIGVGSGQPSNRVLWPLLAFSVVCILWGAWASGWL